MRAMLVTMVAAAALVGVGLVLEAERQKPEGQKPEGQKVVASAQVTLPAAAAPEQAAEPELEERVYELPEDGLVWYTTVIYPSDRESDAASRKVAAWFATDPRLVSLKAQTRFVETTPANQLYAAHVSGQGELPIVWVQRGSTGQRVYKASGDNLPASGKALADEIAKAIAEQCPCRPRPNRPGPRPSPQPSPMPGPVQPYDVPAPEVDPSIEPIPDLRPVDEESPNEGEGVVIPEWAYGLIPLVLVVMAVALERATRSG